MKQRLCSILLIICMLTAGVSDSSHSLANSKAAFYYCTLSSPYLEDNESTRAVTRIIHKKKNIIVKGTFCKSSSWDSFSSGNYIEVKNKSFKLCKNCKFICTYGKGTERKSKHDFFKELDEPWGWTFHLSFYTNSSGKIKSMDFDMSM